MCVVLLFMNISLLAQNETNKQSISNIKLNLTGIISDSFSGKGIGGATIALIFESASVNSISYIKRNGIAPIMKARV